MITFVPVWCYWAGYLILPISSLTVLNSYNGVWIICVIIIVHRQKPALLFKVLNHVRYYMCIGIIISASSKMVFLYWITELFKREILYLLTFKHIVRICMPFAHVCVWMSMCMSLCCHICCYQGNPVGRRRSAERCTAWRRETCGAQPVVGKRPVRDSPTNKVPFLGLRYELFPSRSDSEVDTSTEEIRGVSSQWSSQHCFLQPSSGFRLHSFPFPNTKTKQNWCFKTNILKKLLERERKKNLYAGLDTLF